MDEDYARDQPPSAGGSAHGMLAAAYISAVLGTTCRGRARSIFPVAALSPAGEDRPIRSPPRVTVKTLDAGKGHAIFEERLPGGRQDRGRRRSADHDPAPRAHTAH